MLSRRRKRLLLIALIMSFAIQGCAANSAVMPSPSLSSATETIVPSITKTRSPKPSATSTGTPNDVATANSIETASIGTLVSTVQPTVITSYPSRDRKWRAEVIRYGCSYVFHNYNEKIAYEELKLLNLSDGTEKIVADQRQNCEGLGAFGFKGLYWSPNSRYFYYNESREGYPDGGCGIYIPLIYRLDPVNQEVIMLEGAFISPDKTKLALWQGREIVIWDLNEGEVARVATLKPHSLTGRIWWSKTGNSIVYLQTESQCLAGNGKFYLVSLDLANLSQSLISTYELINTSIASTPVPAGVFVFYFYSPLIMNYDPSIWEMKDGSLRVRDLATCSIAEQGPTDFNGPHSEKIKRLHKISYTILGFSVSASDDMKLAYMADRSVSTDAGLPVFWVSAKSSEWNKCQSLAEEVLATLRFPAQ